MEGEQKDFLDHNHDDDDEDDDDRDGGRNKSQRTKSQQTKFQMMCWDFVRPIIIIIIIIIDPHEGRGEGLFLQTFSS